MILIKILRYFLTKILTSFLADSYILQDLNKILERPYQVSLRSYKDLTKVL